MVKPILFNTEMVRALQEGRKTVTRRAVKFKPGQNPDWSGYTPDGSVLYGSNNIPAVKAPYQPGDILWVRETYCGWCLPSGEWQYCYKATDANGNRAPTGPEYDDKVDVRPWRPSIHMPKEAARLFLRVAGVRAERLREMVLADVLMEGIQEAERYEETWDRWHDTWDSTIRPADLHLYGWEADPWVWVISFERCERPEGWMQKAGEGAHE